MSSHWSLVTAQQKVHTIAVDIQIGILQSLKHLSLSYIGPDLDKSQQAHFLETMRAQALKQFLEHWILLMVVTGD